MSEVTVNVMKMKSNCLPKPKTRNHQTQKQTLFFFVYYICF